MLRSLFFLVQVFKPGIFKLIQGQILRELTPRGNTNALKHGLYTREAITRRRYLRELMRESRETIEALS